MQTLCTTLKKNQHKCYLNKKYIIIKETQIHNHVFAS